MATNLATTKMIQNIINGTTPPQQATKATQDGEGNVIATTYAKQSGSYPNMTVGNATSADNAVNATKATQDGGGNNIVNTYATKDELTKALEGKQDKDDYALTTGNYPDMTVGNATNATNAANATNATTATTATTADKVAQKLSFGNKTYDGSSAQTITKEDLGISSVYTPAGSVAFASLPTPAVSNLGNVYNVTDAFTTDSRFIEGAGKKYPAGTNVGVVLQDGNYMFDVMGSEVDLTNYAQIDGNYPNMTVGNASNAGHATNADSATSATSATNATNATNAETASKVANNLTINVNGNSTVYNGSSAQTIDINTSEGMEAVAISIATSKWSGKNAILTGTDYPAIANVTANSTVQLIAADNSAAMFITNDINLTAQAAGSLTISCGTTPTAAVSGTIMIFN